ncbi:hypothetical protein EDC04DRAFT_1135934 [Pisolithus marmoratus]|nr:hypothetical protein EDC04DRAFT_1135934 [Pisolithus marmoratus]
MCSRQFSRDGRLGHVRRTPRHMHGPDSVFSILQAKHLLQYGKGSDYHDYWYTSSVLVTILHLPTRRHSHCSTTGAYIATTVLPTVSSSSQPSVPSETPSIFVAIPAVAVIMEDGSGIGNFYPDGEIPDLKLLRPIHKYPLPVQSVKRRG